LLSPRDGRATGAWTTILGGGAEKKGLVVCVPSWSGAPVVMSPSTGAPVAVTAAPAPAGVHHVIAGEVTDVDRNSGKVNIRASDGSKVQVILPPLAVATANKGDRASIDVTIAPTR